MSKKVKYQVFISSTYLDLKEERQNIVKAVLSSANIPAGMELFSAGNTTQWELITKWIDESDMYVLLLGGRYGSIEPNSKLSYTELEYDYAVVKKKNLFALVLDDEYLKTKQKSTDTVILESDNIEKFNQFKKKVLSNISAFCTNRDQIEVETLKSILQFQENSPHNMKGWIPADGEKVNKNIDFLQAYIDARDGNNETKIKTFDSLNDAKKELGSGQEFYYSQANLDGVPSPGGKTIHRT
ncbi:MAG: DUF4062 domain-containing protein [Nonlabens sp.]|uniref:DUF4062 domain-containing protein n=1 Tax=Nonlabens sp. TaxID=1888209 RepID=UPI003EF6CDBB